MHLFVIVWVSSMYFTNVVWSLEVFKLAPLTLHRRMTWYSSFSDCNVMY